MRAKAANKFICVCCMEPHNERDAHADEIYVPVCKECFVNLQLAGIYMKHEGIDRCIQGRDINSSTIKRFSCYRPE